MAISLSDNDPRVRYTATSGQTVFAVPFEFFDNDDFDVFEEDTSGSVTQKTLTTHYTVTGGSGSTGSITFGTGITLNHIITIVRNIDIERVTDFTGGAAINRAALNEQLDKLTAITSDIKDVNTRTVRLADWDADATLTLPSVANRADKLLGFDSSGNISTASADLTVDSLTIAYSGTPGEGTFLRANTDADSRIVSENGTLILQSNKGSGVGKVLLDGNASPYVVDITATGGGTRLVSGDVLVDSSGDITLDADGGEIYFKDGGTSKFTFRISAAGNRILADSATTIETSAGAISMKAALGYVDFLTNGGAQSIQLQSTTTPEIRFYQNSNTLDIDVATLTGTRTLTLPDATDTLVGKATTDTLTNKTLTSAVLNGNVSGSAILDEDNMASNSSSRLATQQSIKAYVDAQVATVPTGDITGVIAGTGLTGGGTSGTVTLNINATTGLTATSSTLSIDSSVVTLTGSQTLSNKVLTSPTLNGSIGGSSIKDEDSMASNSASHLATQQSIKAYVDAQVAGGGAGNLSTVLGIGNTTAGNNIVFGDSSGASDDRLTFGADADLSIYHDGSRSIIQDNGTGNLRIQANNLELNNADNSENYLFAANNGAVTLYYDNAAKIATTSSGVTVTGNIANTSGDFTLDVAGDIILDADDGDIFFNDAGTTFARFQNNAGDLLIESKVNDKDMIFRGVDNGSIVTALTLDMSNAGAATFNSFIYLDYIRGKSDINTGVNIAGSDVLAFQTGGSERMRIDSSGNVLIGTTANKGQLTVGDGATGTKTIALNGSASSTSVMNLDFLGGGSGNPSGRIGYSSSTEAMTFHTGDLASIAERMRIDSSGNVGIGTTTSPSSSDVKLVINSSGGGFAQFNFNGGAGSAIGSPAASTQAFYTTTGNIGSDVYTERMRLVVNRLGIGTSSPTSYANSQATLVVEDSSSPAIAISDTGQTRDWFLIALGDGLAIRYADGGGSGSPSNVTEAAFFKNNGNVGINDSNPAYPLEVNGTVRAVGTNNLPALIVDGNSTDEGDIVAATGDHITIGHHGLTGASGQFTERLRLNSSGVILMGSTASTFGGIDATRLAVVGGSNTSSNAVQMIVDEDSTVEGGSTLLAIGFSADNSFSTANYINFFDSGGQQGRIEGAGAGSVAYQTSSDRRLKSNIRDTGSKWDALKQIQVRDYEWTADTSNKTVTGFIAQELHTIFPDAVSEGDEDVTKKSWAVDYGRTTPIIIKALQEAMAKIETLETKIAALEAN